MKSHVMTGLNQYCQPLGLQKIVVGSSYTKGAIVPLLPQFDNNLPICVSQNNSNLSKLRYSVINVFK
jgi:hypothetical protein